MSKLLNKIQKKLNRDISLNIVCKEWHSSIILEGRVDNWGQLIKAGKLAANKGYKGVVNKLEVKGLKIPEIKKPLIKDKSLQNKHIDILIIGGGIVGSAIARGLAKWDCSILLVEKENDLAMQATSRNDGMVHPGLAPKPGSRRAYFNVRGNKMYTKVTKELDVPFKRIGSLLLFDSKLMRLAVPIIKRRARQNGVEGVRFLPEDELRKREPYLASNIKGAIHMPTTGVLAPYKMAIAYAENAVMNGVELSLDTIVLSMKKENGKIISVSTNRGTIYPKLVINAAGVYADKIAGMADDQFFTIHPRKGEIALIDKKKGYLLNSIMAKPSLSTAKSTTKGGGLVKTIDENILVGPNAYEQPFKEDYTTNKQSFDSMLKKQLPLISELKSSDIITYLAGTRAATYEEDFIVEKSEYITNLVHAAGIQSPGFASAPAIAEEIEGISIDILKKRQRVRLKKDWCPKRKGIPELNKMTKEERNRFIKKRPDYGLIVCRCEEISRGEIVDAINSPIPAKSVDAIKRRVRPGMGRCQGGFCLPLVTKIIEEEGKLDLISVTKKGNLSRIVVEETKADSNQKKRGEKYETM